MVSETDSGNITIPLIDQTTITRMQQDLYHLVRRYCKSYEISHFEAELVLHDSTRIKYTKLREADLDRFISLVVKYWDYFSNLSAHLSFYEETISMEYSDKIIGVLDIGKTIKLRGNRSSNNVVCSINFRNICTPENVLLAVILLGINMLAAKFFREICYDIRIAEKYRPTLSKIIDYSGFLLRNRHIRKLVEHYLINYKSLEALALDIYDQITKNRLGEKYSLLMAFIWYWKKYEYIINNPTKALPTAITGYLSNLRIDHLYEIWTLYKLLELFEPMRQSEKREHDHKLFINDQKDVSIQYQASSPIGWILHKGDFTSQVLRRPDMVIRKNRKIKAVIDAKYMTYSESDEETGVKGPNRDIVNQMLIYLDHIGPCDLGIVLFADPVSSKDISVRQGNRSVVFLNCYPYTTDSDSALKKVANYIMDVTVS